MGIFAAAFLYMVVSCENSVKMPPTLQPMIVNQVDHDSTLFTQGLFLHDTVLYESAGQYGASCLASFHARSGALLMKKPLARNIFAEGCARFGQKIVLLTWREQTAFVYSLEDLSELRTLTYAGEGWGLTSDGKLFYMSNGSDTIYVRNSDFTIIKKCAVRAGHTPVTRLNELEWVKGLLYANIWQSDTIAEINPRNGTVLRFIDCSGLTALEKPASPDHVLNGIAFDPAAAVFYLTGKKWKRMFVVKIEK
ncbi:MAG: glutaminyl-peptide cyclotransferase [Chitinispirillaceae bacterium]|nr:glutaminyl-peptide cyclotransferase [Chitinispirillaceae bacterium]